MGFPNFISSPNITWQQYNFNIPSPELQEFPSFREPVFSALESIKLSPEVDVFYSSLFKSVLENKFNQFLTELSNFLSIKTKELDYYLHLETKTQANFLGVELERGSFLGFEAISGPTYKRIKEAHFEEQTKKFEIYKQISSSIYKEFLSLCEQYLSLTSDAQELYASIYRQDVSFRFKFYQEWLKTLEERYNEYLNELRLFIDKANNIYLEKKDAIQKQEANLEKIRWYVEKESLSSEERAAYNEYLEAYQNYLLAYKNYELLQHEQLRAAVASYESKLRKYRTEISQIETTASYISELVQMYLTKADVARGLNRINSQLISTAREELSADSEDLAAQVAVNRAKIEKARAEVDKYRAYLANAEVKISRLKEQYKQHEINYKLDLVSSYKDYLQVREKALDYYSLRETIDRNVAELALPIKYNAAREAIYLNDKWRGFLESDRLKLDAVTFFNKSQVLATSKVTANIVRNITGG